MSCKSNFVQIVVVTEVPEIEKSMQRNKAIRKMK